MGGQIHAQSSKTPLATPTLGTENQSSIPAQRGSPRLYHMSRMDAPMVALMSPYLRGQRDSIALHLRVCPAQLAHPKIPVPGAGTHLARILLRLAGEKFSSCSESWVRKATARWK